MNKLKDFFSWIKIIWRLPFIVRDNHTELLEEIEIIKRQQDIEIRYINDLKDLVHERCEVHADIHYKAPSQIIVIGKYKGRDYVRTFSVDEPFLQDIIERLNYEEKNSKVGRFDMPGNWPNLSVVYGKNKF